MDSRIRTSDLQRPVPPMSATQFMDEVIQRPRRRRGDRRPPAERPLWIIQAMIRRISNATASGFAREIRYFTANKACWFASKSQANPYEIYPSDVIDELTGNRSRYIGEDAIFEQISICGVNKHLTIVTETVVFQSESLTSGQTSDNHAGGPGSKKNMQGGQTPGRPTFFSSLPNTGIASRMAGGAQ